MLRATIGIVVMAVMYAVFAVLYRDKQCSGNCGACSGTCHATGEKYDND